MRVFSIRRVCQHKVLKSVQFPPKSKFYQAKMDKFCRICLRADDFRKFDITTISQISGVRIEDMLIYCTQLDVSSKDSLPQQICDECLAALSACFVFKKLCFRAETSIREMLKNQASEMQPEPSLEYELSLMDAEFPEVGYSAEPKVEPVIEPLESNPEAVPEAAGQPTVECPSSNANETNLPNQEQLAGAGEDHQSQVSEKVKLRKMLACNECDYKTPQKRDIVRHQNRKNHSGFKTIISEVIPIKRTQLFICKGCNFRTIVRSSIEAHRVDTKHPYMSTMDVRLQKTWVCNGCGYRSTSKHNFLRHQRIKAHSDFKEIFSEVFSE